MTASTLTEFLLARIAEDEVHARRLLRYSQENELACSEPQMLGKRIPGWHEWPDVQAMCSRVLADCEAKRRIVEDHNMVHAGCPGSPTLTSDDGEQDGTYGGPCAVLRNLASVYSDHPDYDEAWRP